MSTARASRPSAAKPIAMPADDGVRLHDNQRRAPVSPTSRESHPKESIACPQAASRRSVEGRQLLPQRQVFQDQFPMAAECQRDCADDHDEQLQHAVIVVGVGAKFNSDEFWRWSGIDDARFQLLALFSELRKMAGHAAGGRNRSENDGNRSCQNCNLADPIAPFRPD